MGYKKGDSVVSTGNIGGVRRDSVPAGSRGTVTGTRGGEPARVAFRVSGNGVFADKTVEVDVNGREVR
jgi:hypothetical protein